MFRLHISSEAEKEIKKIKKIYQKAVIEALREIEDDPFSGKPLTMELTGHFAYKIGVYRLIYKVDIKDRIVEIVTAGHRSTIYS